MKSKHPIPLADAVQRHQAQCQLDDSQLERLLAMQQAPATDSSEPSAGRGQVSPNRRRRWLISARMVATFAVALLLGSLIASLLAPIDDRPMLARIADEVATNHLYLLRGQDLRLLIEKGIFVLVGTTGHFMPAYLPTSE